MTPKEAWEFLREQAPICIYGGGDAIAALKPLMAEALACQHDFRSANMGPPDARVFRCALCGEEEERDVS